MFFKRLSPNKQAREDCREHRFVQYHCGDCNQRCWEPTLPLISALLWRAEQMSKCESSHRTLTFLARLCFQSKLKTIGVMGSVRAIKFQINIFIPNSSPPSSLSGFCYLPGKHSFIRLWRTPFWAWSFCFSLECTREMSEFALESLFVIAKVFFEVANLIFGEYTKYRKKEKEKDNCSLFTD